MRILGEEVIAAGTGKVWQALNDPQVLQRCIPGCQSIERQSDQKLRAVVEVRIGPIGARFNSVVTLCDVRPSQGYTLIGEGQGGTVGSAKATIRVRLEDNGASTRLSYELDAQVGGRLAQLGGPVIDATAKQFAAKFFKRFRELLGGAGEIAPSAPANELAPATPADPHVTPAARSTSANPGFFPHAWILAVVVAALVGFLVGRGQGAGSDWMGLSIGLLIIVVAIAGVEYGRRIAAPQIVVDAALVERLLRRDKQ